MVQTIVAKNVPFHDRFFNGFKGGARGQSLKAYKNPNSEASLVLKKLVGLNRKLNSSEKFRLFGMIGSIQKEMDAQRMIAIIASQKILLKKHKESFLKLIFKFSIKINKKTCDNLKFSYGLTDRDWKLISRILLNNEEKAIDPKIALASAKAIVLNRPLRREEIVEMLKEILANHEDKLLNFSHNLNSGDLTAIFCRTILKDSWADTQQSWLSVRKGCGLDINYDIEELRDVKEKTVIYEEKKLKKKTIKTKKITNSFFQKRFLVTNKISHLLLDIFNFLCKRDSFFVLTGFNNSVGVAYNLDDVTKLVIQMCKMQKKDYEFTLLHDDFKIQDSLYNLGLNIKKPKRWIPPEPKTEIHRISSFSMKVKRTKRRRK